MKGKKGGVILVFLFAMFVFSINASAGSNVLKYGVKNSNVVELQNDLKKLGFFPKSVNSTGYYGNITKNAVKQFQTSHGILIDGIAGPQTFSALAKEVNPASSVSINSIAFNNSKFLLPWFDEVENIFKRGDKATVYDILSGKSYNIVRGYGYNHADCETLTANDTKIMLQTYGGDFSWERRPIIVYTNGFAIAASVAGMPHAGRDDKASATWVSNRSYNYGTGYNLDSIKNNNMDGVFDVHFLNSRTHGTNSVNAAHQNAIKIANNWAKKNVVK